MSIKIITFAREKKRHSITECRSIKNREVELNVEPWKPSNNADALPLCEKSIFCWCKDNRFFSNCKIICKIFNITYEKSRFTVFF